MRRLWLKHLLVKYTLDLQPVYFVVMCALVGVGWVFYRWGFIAISVILVSIAALAGGVLILGIIQYIKRSLHKSYEQFAEEYEKKKREENYLTYVEEETRITPDTQIESTAWFD